MNSLLNAIIYYSRIPVPCRIDSSPEIMSRALRWLPLVGLLVGTIGFGVFYISSLALPYNVAVVCAICAMVLATGAFHEDGFADLCDGFGGGYDREAILRIMKDSHIGCYGVIGLVSIFLLRYTLLTAMAGVDEGDMTTMALVLILSQGASRFAPVLMVRCSQYARQGSLESSKATHSALGVTSWGVIVSGVVALAPLALLGGCFSVVYISAMLLATLSLRAYTQRHIGGFTGDTLGALQVICEMIFYISIFISSFVSTHNIYTLI